jgi:hypothetical protein
MDRRNVLLAALSAPLLGAETEVFVGTPLIRVDTDATESKRTELSDTAGKKYECRVVRQGRKYFWASRGSRELTRANAGDWTYYVSPEGSGYVKVLSGDVTLPYEYMEHVTSELKTVTYWGKRAG